MMCIQYFLLIFFGSIIKSIAAHEYNYRAGLADKRTDSESTVLEEYDDDHYIKSKKITLEELNSKKGPCFLDIQTDFGNPAPICVYNGSLLEMDRNGLFRMEANERLTISCPGHGRVLVFGGDVYESKNELSVQCVRDNKFKVGRYWKGRFKKIECNAPPYAKINNTRKSCAGFQQEQERGEIYTIGFQVDGVLHPLYEACFNSLQLSTFYVHHNMLPQVHLRQLGGSRPYYATEKQVYGRVKIFDVYNIFRQRRMVNLLMDEDPDADYYINEINFLARSQMAPRLDFMMRTAQRASYTYINTLPQWKHIKFGDWKTLEHALRLRAHRLNKNLEVWTGRFGIWAPWRHRRSKGTEPIYLAQHPLVRLQKIVPVPLYVYKLVYVKDEKKATAFVSVNLPSTATDQELQSKVFCDNICRSTDTASKFNWLNLKNNRSLIFCCRYNDFVREVQYLPVIYVNDEFY